MKWFELKCFMGFEKSKRKIEYKNSKVKILL